MFPCPSDLRDIYQELGGPLLERFSLHAEPIGSHTDKKANGCSVELGDLVIAEIDAGLVSLGDVAECEGHEEGVERGTNVEAVHGGDLLVDCPTKDPERAETKFVLLNECHL